MKTEKEFCLHQTGHLSGRGRIRNPSRLWKLNVQVPGLIQSSFELRSSLFLENIQVIALPAVLEGKGTVPTPNSKKKFNLLLKTGRVGFPLNITFWSQIKKLPQNFLSSGHVFSLILICSG